MQTFSLIVKKMARRAPFTLELELTRTHALEPVDLWPELALRALADLEGSPLADAPLYDAAWLKAHAAELIGEVELLKAKGPTATYRFEVRDAALAGLLKRGLAWETRHRPTSAPEIIDAAWTLDSKGALLGYDHGLARLFGVTKKGLGRVKAILNHPGLRAVGCLPEALMTAGRDRVLVWDLKGKGALHAHAFDVEISCAAVRGDEILVGFEDGSVRIIGGATLAEPGDAPVTALASWVADHQVAAGFADGRILIWGADNQPRGAREHEAAITALGFDGEGALMAASADGVLRVGEVTRPAPVREGLLTIHAALSAQGDELLFDGYDGRVYLTQLPSEGARPLLEAPDTLEHQLSPSGEIRAVLAAHPKRLYLFNREGERLRFVQGPSISPFAESFAPTLIGQFSPSEERLAIHHMNEDHKDGAVIVLEVFGGGAVVLPNEDADYAWAESVAWIDEDRLLVGYANERTKIWSVSARTFTYLDDGEGHSVKLRTSERGIALQRDRSSGGQILEIFSREDLSKIASFPIAGLFGECYPPTAQLSRDGRTALLHNPFQDLVVAWEDRAPWILKGTHDAFDGAALSPSGAWLLVHLKEGKVLEIWDVAERRVVARVSDLPWTRFSFTPAEDAILCLQGDGVKRLSFEGALTSLFESEARASKPSEVRAIQALQGYEPVFVTRGRGYSWDGPKRKATRFEGWKILSPNGERLLTVWTHGAGLHDPRYL